MGRYLVDNVNTITELVDHINQKAMSTRPPSRQLAALTTLMTLFGGVKKALRHQLHTEAEPAVAPMLLRMLQLCQRHPGITQQGLAQRTGRDKGQVARLIRELLDLGLLSRQDNPDDRRSHHLLPTPAGVAAVARFEQAEAEVARLLFGHLTAAELGGLTAQLGMLRERLAQQLPEQDAG